MKKTVISIILLLAMVFTLAACNEDKQPSVATTEGPVATAAPTENTVTTEEAPKKTPQEILADAINADGSIPMIMTGVTHARSAATVNNVTVTAEQVSNDTSYFDGKNTKTVSETTMDGETTTESTWVIKNDTGYTYYILSDGMYIYSELTDTDYAEMESFGSELREGLEEFKVTATSADGSEITFKRDVTMEGIGTGPQTIVVKNGKIVKIELEMTITMTIDGITTVTQTSTTQEIQYTDVPAITLPADWDHTNQVFVPWASIKDILQGEA